MTLGEVSSEVISFLNSLSLFIFSFIGLGVALRFYGVVVTGLRDAVRRRG